MRSRRADFHPLEPRRLCAAVLSVSNPVVAESTKFATFHVTLSAASTKAVTLTYATQSRTAVAGSDFKATAGTLTLAPGRVSGDIRVPLINDDRVEATETFRLAFSANGARLSKTFATATIKDDEALPTLSVSSAGVTEGTGKTGARTASVTVTLAPPASGDGRIPASDVPVTVRYSTVAKPGFFGSATAGVDFLSVSGAFTFSAGQTTKTIKVPILADSRVEGNETFGVVLFDPTGAAIATGTGTGTVTITDDDTALANALPVLHLAAGENATTPTVVSKSAFITTASLPVSIPAATDHDVFVDFTLPALGTSPGEVTGTSGTLRIPAGQTSANINFFVQTDVARALNHNGTYDTTLIVRLSDPFGATLPGGASSLLYTVPIRFQLASGATPGTSATA